MFCMVGCTESHVFDILESQIICSVCLDAPTHMFSMILETEASVLYVFASSDGYDGDQSDKHTCQSRTRIKNSMQALTWSGTTTHFASHSKYQTTATVTKANLNIQDANEAMLLPNHITTRHHPGMQVYVTHRQVPP